MLKRPLLASSCSYRSYHSLGLKRHAKSELTWPYFEAEQRTSRHAVVPAELDRSCVNRCDGLDLTVVVGNKTFTKVR